MFSGAVPRYLNEPEPHSNTRMTGKCLSVWSLVNLYDDLMKLAIHSYIYIPVRRKQTFDLLHMPYSYVMYTVVCVAVLVSGRIGSSMGKTSAPRGKVEGSNPERGCTRFLKIF